MLNTSKVRSYLLERAGAEHGICRTYQKQLELSESHLTSLLADTDASLELLKSLRQSFRDVEAQTTTFQSQCEGLIRQQKRTEELVNEIEHNLKYYNYLEPVTRRLNAPGAGNFVRSKDFSEMLARIDDCLEYMSAHVRCHHYYSRSLTDLFSKIKEKPPHTCPGFAF